MVQAHGDGITRQWWQVQEKERMDGRQGTDIFAYRDARRLAAWLGFCLVQARGRYLLLSDCESDQVIHEFTDLQNVKDWLESSRFSPCSY